MMLNPMVKTPELMDDAEPRSCESKKWGTKYEFGLGGGK